MSTLTAIRATPSRTSAAAGEAITTSANSEPANRPLTRDVRIDDAGSLGAERLVEGPAKRFLAVRRMQHGARVARDGCHVIGRPCLVERDDDDGQACPHCQRERAAGATQAR